MRSSAPAPTKEPTAKVPPFCTVKVPGDKIFNGVTELKPAGLEPPPTTSVPFCTLVTPL